MGHDMRESNLLIFHKNKINGTQLNFTLSAWNQAILTSYLSGDLDLRDLPVSDVCTANINYTFI